MLLGYIALVKKKLQNTDWRSALLTGKMNHVITFNLNISKQGVCCHVFCSVVCIINDNYTTIPVLTLWAWANSVNFMKYMIMQSQYYNIN